MRFLIIAFAALSISLAACGKKGDLAPPPGSQPPADEEERRN